MRLNFRINIFLSCQVLIWHFWECDETPMRTPRLNSAFKASNSLEKCKIDVTDNSAEHHVNEDTKIRHLTG